MDNLIVVTGGVRSGKSNFATGLARIGGKKVEFLATCIPGDKEMKERVKKHKKDRPKNWKTIEEGYNLSGALLNLEKSIDVVIIDCLTIYISNLLLKGMKEKDIQENIERLMHVIGLVKKRVIIVTNEIGMGVVPATKLGRNFRDIAGRMNQHIAKEAGKVFMLVSGIPLKLK